MAGPLAAKPPLPLLRVRYVIKDLGAPGGAASLAYGVNSSGQVAGAPLGDITLRDLRSMISAAGYKITWHMGSMESEVASPHMKEHGV
jgi:uncharacterized membrane protein